MDYYGIVDSLQPLINQSENQEAFPVFSKVDFTMCIDEVKEYMKSKLPNVKNIVLCGMEVKILVGIDYRHMYVFIKLVLIYYNLVILFIFVLMVSVVVHKLIVK